jgi:hypothetical protein
VFASGTGGEPRAPDSPDAPAVDEDDPSAGDSDQNGDSGPGGFVEEG